MGMVDMTGKRFGRYTVLYRTDNDKFGNAVWMCQCDCGTIKAVNGGALRKGVTVSCGCFHRDKVTQISTTHGKSRTKLFSTWQHMKARCNNPNHKHYKYYGGKGIKLCPEWEHDFSSFEQWAINNGYAEGLTIDRINPDKGYEPFNCRWATRQEQQSHISSCHMYEIDGISHNLAEWCRIYNVPHERVRRRVVKEHWDILKALTTPALDRNGNPKKSL